MANEKPIVKKIIKILSVLLVVSVIALAGVLIAGYLAPVQSTSVVVPDNIITSEEIRSSHFGSGFVLRASAAEVSSTANRGAQDTTLSLHKYKIDDNVRFNAGNMFPGDRITQTYRVRVSHKDNVIVHFRVDVDPLFNGLKDVLKCRVQLEGSEVVYDGLMKDMPASMDVALRTDRRTHRDVTYEITAYLDTSVGNAYMNESLLADFRWWVDGEYRPALIIGSTPKTGDQFPLSMWAYVGGGSLLLLILLLAKRRKEDEEDAKG